MTSYCADARVSVIIPTRNNLDTLPAAICSVGAQQVFGVEIIVIDDGSTDGTADWLQELERENRNIRVLKGEARGPAAARNLGITVACAPIIAFLDADDVWRPGKLRVQLAYMEKHPEIGMSFTDYLHIGPDGDERGTCFDYVKPAFANQPPSHFFEVEHGEAVVLALNPVGTSTVAVRKELLQKANGFCETLQSAEDWQLWLALARMAPIAATTMVGMTYLMRPGSETSRVLARIEAMEEIITPYADRQEPSIRRAYRQAKARVLTARAEASRMAQAYPAAMNAQIKALAAAPSKRALRAAARDALSSLMAAPARKTV